MEITMQVRTMEERYIRERTTRTSDKLSNAQLQDKG